MKEQRVFIWKLAVGHLFLSYMKLWFLKAVWNTFYKIQEEKRNPQYLKNCVPFSALPFISNNLGMSWSSDQ